MTITKRQLIDSLYSRTCPACGSRKGEHRTLCYGCFSQLPGALKGRLYARVGQGYEEAVKDAMTALGAPKFREPVPTA